MASHWSPGSIQKVYHGRPAFIHSLQSSFFSPYTEEHQHQVSCAYFSYLSASWMRLCDICMRLLQLDTKSEINSGHQVNIQVTTTCQMVHPSPEAQSWNTDDSLFQYPLWYNQLQKAKPSNIFLSWVSTSHVWEAPDCAWRTLFLLALLVDSNEQIWSMLISKKQNMSTANAAVVIRQNCSESLVRKTSFK